MPWTTNWPGRSGGLPGGDAGIARNRTDWEDHAGGAKTCRTLSGARDTFQKVGPCFSWSRRWHLRCTSLDCPTAFSAAIYSTRRIQKIAVDDSRFPCALDALLWWLPCLLHLWLQVHKPAGALRGQRHKKCVFETSKMEPACSDR